MVCKALLMKYKGMEASYVHKRQSSPAQANAFVQNSFESTNQQFCICEKTDSYKHTCTNGNGKTFLEAEI